MTISRTILLALALIGAGDALAAPGIGSKQFRTHPRIRNTRNDVLEIAGPVAIGAPPLRTGFYEGLTASLHLVQAISGQATLVIDTISPSTSNQSGTLVIRRARGAGLIPSAVQTGDVLGTIGFGGYGGSTAAWKGPLAGALGEGGAALEAYPTENWTGTTFGTQLSFYNVKTGSNALTERLRFDGSGTTTAWQNVTDVPVLCAASVATNDDPTYCIYEGRQTVTGNQTINVLTIPTTTGMSYFVNATIMCRCTSGSACTAGHTRGDVRTALYRSSGGTATEIEEQAVHAGIFDGTEDTATTFDIAPSGANILIRAAGVANENLVCHATAEVQKDMGT